MKMYVFVRLYIDSTLKEAVNKEVIGIAILVVVLCVSPVIILLVRNAAATIQIYALNLAQKAIELKREKRKSDSLLFQMLPATVAVQLKQTQQVRWQLLISIIFIKNRSFWTGASRTVRVCHRILQ